MTTEPRRFDGGRRLIVIGLVLGVGGAVGTAVGFVLQPQRAFFSYLTAWTYVLSVVLGALVFLMAAHAMRATWPVAIRRVPEAITAAMPLVAVLFFPLLFGLRHLYPWTRPETFPPGETRHLLEHKLVFMNAPFFSGRAILYLGVFTFAAFMLRRWSLRGDEGAASQASIARQQRLSAAFLPPVGLALTFAAFDLLMSLSPDWYSTMFGFYFFAGAFVGGLALITIVASAAAREGLLAGLQRSHWYALGRLLFAFVVFWGYIAYFQFFIVWIANKPIEAHWFVDRVNGAQRAVSIFLAVAMFGFPFFALLPYGIKQRPGGLVVLSGWLLFAHYVDLHWLVIPARQSGGWFSAFDITALLAVGGLTLAFAVWRQRGLFMVPVGDPRLPRALEYHSR